MNAKLIKLIKSVYYNLEALKYLINLEIGNKSYCCIRKRIWCLLHGFSSEKYVLYNLQQNDYKQYLSDFHRYKTRVINGSYAVVLNDKYVFSKLVSNDIIAKIYGKIERGCIVLENVKTDVNDLVNLIKINGNIIVKKNHSGGGKEIYKISTEDGNILVNDKNYTLNQFNEFVKTLDDHLIEEYLTQAEYLKKIYPYTINTIRIITMIDPDTGEAFIPIAIHKFGSEKTKPADNVWRGGMTALIDLDTGVLQKSAIHYENNKVIEWQPLHPDTKAKIEGTIIPNWQRVKEKVIELANQMNFLKYAGWDVVVTDNEIKVIEGNNYSDVNILQIHQPLLADNRVKKFFKYHGIL